jgi:hypothetical protein
MCIGNTCDTLTNATGSIAMGPTTVRKSPGTELEFLTLRPGNSRHSFCKGSAQEPSS